MLYLEYFWSDRKFPAPIYKLAFWEPSMLMTETSVRSHARLYLNQLIHNDEGAIILACLTHILMIDLSARPCSKQTSVCSRLKIKIAWKMSEILTTAVFRSIGGNCSIISISRVNRFWICTVFDLDRLTCIGDSVAFWSVPSPWKAAGYHLQKAIWNLPQEAC